MSQNTVARKHGTQRPVCGTQDGNRRPAELGLDPTQLQRLEGIRPQQSLSQTPIRLGTENRYSRRGDFPRLLGQTI